MAYKDQEKQREARRLWAAKARAEKTSHQHKMRELLNEIKEGKPCADCGVVYPTYVMDFDHLDDQDKVINVGKAVRGSREKLLAEVAKCEIVCSNCHRIRTFNRGQWQKSNALKRTEMT